MGSKKKKAQKKRRREKKGGKRAPVGTYEDIYAKTPGGSKKSGRNKRGSQGTTIDDKIKGKNIPPSEMPYFQQSDYVDGVVGRERSRRVSASPDTSLVSLTDSPQGYDDSNDLHYDEWQVQRFLNLQGRVRNSYEPNQVGLIVYDEKRKSCLLVGAWSKLRTFIGQMKALRENTGSTIETHDHRDLGIQTALVYSTDPSQVKEALSVDAKVLTSIKPAHNGNLLTCHSFENCHSIRKLQDILACYLHQAEPQYFSS